MHGRSRIAAVLGLAVAAATLHAAPATASPDGTGLVISEVYGGGGNTSAPFRSDFIELYNPTDAAISLAGKSVQYRSASGSAGGAAVALSGSVAAHGHFLINGSDGANTALPALPTPDATTTFSMSGTAGQVLLINGSSFTGTGNVAGNAGLIDMVGYGTGNNTFEGATMGANLTNSTAATRSAAGADTDNNAADFSSAAPDPQNSGSPGGGTGGDKTIAEIQGTGAASALVGQTVHTTGIVTAAYPTGGFNGIYIQTPGTGGGTDATPDASDAIFVFGANSGAGTVALGDHVDVTGVVSEFNGLTEITPAAGGVVPASGSAAPVTPRSMPYPATEADREKHEGELLAPTDTFTVTNTFGTNQFAEIGLATGTKPLLTPTEVADAQDTAAIVAVTADNAARKVTLDDGASINFLSNATNKAIPLPWLAPSNPVRVGARATFSAPVILDWRNNLWKFQPQQRVTGTGTSVVGFTDTRNEAPEAVPGNIRLATFNVLNYFNTLGVDYAAAGHTCTFFDDRDGNHNTVNDCGATGPRGAAEADDLTRQQTKIVAAINALGADVVSLEEIENSAQFGIDRDDALASLVTALNAAAGSTRWAYAPSPDAADLPPLAEQDVIRTAFIYNPGTISLVGASKVLVGSAAFGNAREPLAQAFKPKGAADSSTFAVVVNHFKSKGSGTDDGTGQGNANPDRIAQAQALVPFANDFAAARGTDKVFLTGDFNSYSKEDPIQVLEGAGYQLVNSDDPNEWTYSFDGMSGSLDHVLANDAARGLVAGADVWGINSGESVAWEYSRTNYNVSDLYQPNMFRASDHDPEIVGLDVAAAPAPVTLNLLGVNDFHGRINANTVKWAGTVEQLTEQGGADKTLLIGAGDLIGASEFASASQNDQPTIDMFNALGLDASAVGNHEFDRGWHDLRDRVIGAPGSRNAQWDYLGANVYAKGTQDPVLPEYATFTVQGVKVAVIGAVTEETRSLVSPGGITEIDFGNPVDAVNRVAHELSDGDPANGEADVIVASFHAGATQGLGSSYAAEVAKGGEFAQMANLDPAVDAIFNGHTHQAYAWDAPVPGQPGRTRPIIQTGEYGNNVGQVQLVVDPGTGGVTSYTVRNVARTTVADATLVAQYPRVAQVKTIVDAALAQAAAIGSQPVGSVTADITRAFNGTTEDRGSESTIGDLVANALRDGLPSDIHADLGIVNPGGLRADLKYDADGVITYAEANAVLPFVNNIWTVKLTGAQLRSVLEQQWQPSGASRPFLALGLSDNVRVTQDPTRPAGSRITSVVVDGEPLDPAHVYTVSTFSFLGTGGDNFAAFAQGTPADTGLVDRDLWISYLQHHPGLSPDFARQQVVENGLPGTVTAGQAVSFTLSKLDLTSLGSPANTSVTAYLRSAGTSRKIGTFPVAGGTAAITFTVPEDIASATVTVVANPTGTLVGLPLTTVVGAPVKVTAEDKTITYGESDPAFTFTATGFRSGDGFVTAPTCGVAGPHSDAGTYPIVCSGGDAGEDYAISYVAGTLTVTKAPVTITAQEVSFLKSLLTGRFTFRGTVRNAVTGTAAVGVPVTATAKDSFGRTLRCTGTTDATGAVTCTDGGNLLLLLQSRYTVTSAATANYLAGTATGTVAY
ncbi:MAG: ExeM/NucH family extracellular endonuclease [Nocardioidaceae bacterium]|nr:ExeM/NucH family extracellular endonuclease [Nocardioidaceae bacterium]